MVLSAKIFNLIETIPMDTIWCRRMGAKVYTVEKDLWVLKAASLNPWSRLLEDPGIEVILLDAYEFVKMLSDSSFHRILHDPP